MANVKIKQFRNKAKEPVAGLTPEHAVYDKNGVRLDAKLGNVNLQEFRDLQYQGVNAINKQEIQSIQAVANREAEILSKSDASLVSANTDDLEGNNVQENLDSAAKKLKELELKVIYDVSAYNDGAVFESLSAILSSPNLSTLIPTSVRHGGMSIRFVQSSDNKYVQYFLTKDEWSASDIDWEKMNLEEDVSQLGQKVDYNSLSHNKAAVFGFTRGSINYLTGTEIDNTMTLRTDYIVIDRSMALYLYMNVPSINSSDIYVVKYLNGQYAGYFQPQSASIIDIDYDGTFNAVRLRIGALNRDPEDIQIDCSCFALKIPIVQEIENIDSRLFNVENTIYNRVDSKFFVGCIDYLNGKPITVNTGIRSLFLPLTCNSYVYLTLPTRTNLAVAFIIKYLNGNYVGYEVGHPPFFPIQKDASFDSIRVMVLDNSTWSDVDAANSSISLLQIKEKAEIPIVKYLEVETRNAISASSLLDNVFMGPSWWASDVGRSAYINSVEEGDVVIIKAKESRDTFIGFTDFFINSRGGDPLSFTRITIPAGTMKSFIVPRGATTLIINAVYNPSVDYTPLEATILHFGIKKYDYKTERVDYQKVEGGIINFMRSAIVDTKVLKIANQNIVPTDGVYLSFYDGNLVLTINGIKHNIKYE